MGRWGDILGIKKLDKPSYLGQRKPKDEIEEKQMVEYNARDSEISMKAMRFMIDTFNEIGASFKPTIAASAMSLFRNNYLKNIFYRLDIDILDDIMQSMYGGRTECFQRGVFYDVNYYDVNSLYPSCMKNDMPDPNTHRVTRKNTTRYIMRYEGCSEVDILSPDMHIPLLPLRFDKKLIFPTGRWKAWYTHLELRKAMKLGYVIEKVHKTHYFKSTCRPFDDYVDDMYSLRDRWKRSDDKKELIAKLLMNALYGKFNQRYKGRDSIIHESNVTMDMLEGEFERVGEFFRFTKDVDPALFCIPIWSAYITSYARILMYELIKDCDPIYMDTDSIITKKDMPTSKILGELKLEMKIENGITVKPKFYGFVDKRGKPNVKIKGISQSFNITNFVQFLKDPKYYYKKFLKFKESLRRNKIPNEIIDMCKELSLEDNKRDWGNKVFSSEELQTSKPIHIDKFAEELRLAEEAYEKSRMDAVKQIIESDLFDSHSVGNDISSEEFIENEKFFALND